MAGIRWCSYPSRSSRPSSSWLFAPFAGPGREPTGTSGLPEFRSRASGPSNGTDLGRRLSASKCDAAAKHLPTASASPQRNLRSGRYPQRLRRATPGPPQGTMPPPLKVHGNARWAVSWMFSPTTGNAPLLTWRKVSGGVRCPFLSHFLPSLRGQPLTSHGRVAAVDQVVGTSYERGLFREEEANHVGHLLRRAQPAEGVLVCEGTHNVRA